MEKVEITVNLTHYIENKLCSVCDQKCNNVDAGYISGYNKYLQQANERFGKYSIPVCYSCWRRRCEKCGECGIPLSFGFSNSLGVIIMTRTTLEQEAEKLDHVCITCAKRMEN